MADEHTPPTPPAPPPAAADGNGYAHNPLNISEELKDSYLNYAMSVIVSRALPDVRDGLKPSQRRILVAMHDLGLGPTAGTSKCAGIVGETMKRYHPHGEQTIYPTLVRMAQDWNMRHRLVHSQGNFGSIAGLPPAAMRYCVTGDTVVETVAGPRCIADLASVAPNSDADIDLEVFNYAGQVVHASKLFHSGDHPTIRLRTRDGYELIGTSNHPLLCRETVAGAEMLRWKLLKDIRPGTRVAMPRPSLELAAAVQGRASKGNAVGGRAVFTPKGLDNTAGGRVLAHPRRPSRAPGTPILNNTLPNPERVLQGHVAPLYNPFGVGGGGLVATAFRGCASTRPPAVLSNPFGVKTARHAQPTTCAPAGYHYAEVASVEDAGVQPVYSIRVDSDCHSFITNGFVSHNTEARLTPVAAEMLADLDSDTVDFGDNYDGKYREPLVLPSKFPNLLVNGSDGIAVGMATDIPPHNLREVCDAIIKVIDEPDVSVEELVEIIPGPDFPTGGIIRGRQGILDGYSTGRGKITLRARAEIREEGRSSAIVITEVPYQQTRNRLAEAIGELVKNERIKGVSEIRDESSVRTGEPVRLVVYLKRDADPHLVLNQLYEFSPLEKTVSIIMLALVDGQPRTLPLKDMILEYIRHRKQVIRRRTEYLLREAKRRGHLLEGQLIAISSLEEVISICRNSPSRAEAKLRLQNLEVAATVLGRALGAEHFAALQREIGAHPTYRMTEVQADAVVRLQLGQLAALERDEIIKEYNELREKIVGYERLLSSERNILDVVKKDLAELRDKYGDERRTEITGEVGHLTDLDLIEEEMMAVTISHAGYIKRLPISTYRSQHRGGKGVSGGGAREDDFIEHFFLASTHAYLLCFTNRGQLYWLRVHEIPEQRRTGAGRAIANVLSLKPEEKITSVIPVRDFDRPDHCLLMATRRGLVKKTPLADYSRVRAGGIIGINLDDGDTLIDVALVKRGDEVVLSTRRGMAIRFDEADARAMGRNTRGVKGINLAGDDEVVGMVVADPDGYLLTVCENGYGKRTPFGANRQGEAPEEPAAEEVSEEAPAEEVAGEDGAEEGGRESSQKYYRKQRRGGKGIRDIRTTERNGPVVGVASVRDGDDIMLITVGGMVNRTHVREISVVGRNTQGVRVMGLKEGDKLASLAKLAPEEVAAEAPAAGETPAQPDA